VEIEGQYHNVYVIKRPGVDAFMKRVGELYEVVVFTASVSKASLSTTSQMFISLTFRSTAIPCLINSISTESSTTGCSVRAATTTKATM
jgi:hypothetical protein